MVYFINILVSYAYNYKATCQELLPKENSETPLKENHCYIFYLKHTLYKVK